MSEKQNILTNDMLRYRNNLLQETMPFWFPRSADTEFGGFINAAGRDGTRMQTDKYVWFQGRSVWTLCTLYQTERNEQWLDDARKGIEFIDRYCYDENGKAYFSVTQEGRPLTQAENVFSDIYQIIGKSAYATATNDTQLAQKILSDFQSIVKNVQSARTNDSPHTLAIPMLFLVTAQELRKAVSDLWLTQVIDDAIEEVEKYLWQPEYSCVLETTDCEGKLIDSIDGRTVCPGHSLETCWFILEEARLRNNDSRLIQLGTTIFDGTFQRAWDKKFGGLFQLCDCKNFPPSEVYHDMKFWWTHTEAIIASLLAWTLTSEEKYWTWYRQLHDWSYSHFHDSQFGEWFGFLHRDGTLAVELKGNASKGAFHLPRMEWYCWQLLQNICQ